MGALTEPDVTNSLFPLASNAISCLQYFELSGSQNLQYGTELLSEKSSTYH